MQPRDLRFRLTNRRQSLNLSWHRKLHFRPQDIQPINQISPKSSTTTHHIKSVTMVQYIITPWRSQTELLHVRQQLYPDPTLPLNVQDRKQAVAQVSVWMQRGNCPHLVESTAILTSAILNDVPGNSTYCVRAAYSAAFCRYVSFHFWWADGCFLRAFSTVLGSF